jgi:hypothetical protein
MDWGETSEFKNLDLFRNLLGARMFDLVNSHPTAGVGFCDDWAKTAGLSAGFIFYRFQTIGPTSVDFDPIRNTGNPSVLSAQFEAITVPVIDEELREGRLWRHRIPIRY